MTKDEVAAEMGRCVHFNGVFVNEACRAGVNYHELLGSGPGCFKAIPCLKDRKSEVVCPKAQFPTREQAEQEIRDTEAAMERFDKAHAAARTDAKAKGLREGHGGHGSIPCPSCDGGTLRYSVASYNGHMHGSCSTKGCVSWME